MDDTTKRFNELESSVTLLTERFNDLTDFVSTLQDAVLTLQELMKLSLENAKLRDDISKGGESDGEC